MMRALLLTALLTGCTAGDRYLIAPETLSTIQAAPADARERLVAPAIRQRDDQPVNVRASTFALAEAKPLGDKITVPTRVRSHRIVLGNVLVWIGTPLSIAGLCMTIFGHDAVRWSGIAIAGSAEPVMIAGTVLWVKGSKERTQELPPGLANLTYLPTPGVLDRH